MPANVAAICTGNAKAAGTITGLTPTTAAIRGSAAAQVSDGCEPVLAPISAIRSPSTHD
jgi:sugar phosphate permease